MSSTSNMDEAVQQIHELAAGAVGDHQVQEESDVEDDLTEDENTKADEAKDIEKDPSAAQNSANPGPVLESPAKATGKKRKKHPLLKHFNTGVKFFDWPRARFEWGQQQHEAHTVWGSLFFDLIFVGVAFQLGNVLADGIKQNKFPQALGLFTCLYSVLEVAWMQKMHFDARYEADDLFHRCWQIIIGAIIALATSTISLERMLDVDDNSTLTFSCCALVYTAVETIPYLGMLVRETKPNVKKYAGIVLVTRLVMALFLVGSIICSALKGPIYVTALLWFLFGNTFRTRLVYLLHTKGLRRETMIPMHVDFGINRLGEFLMLMLGESIISIIVVGLTPTASFIITYLLAYVLVATLAMTIFNALPSHPDQHAMRRSAMRSALYFLLYTIQVMCLIAIGAGFKLMLTSTEVSYSKLVPYTWLLGGSLTILNACVLVGRVVHHGIHEEYFLLLDNTDKIKKIGFWALKIVGIFMYLVAPAMKAYSWGIMLFYVCIAIFLFIVQSWDLQAFEAHHRRLIEAEVQKRIDLFKAEYDAKQHHPKQS